MPTNRTYRSRAKVSTELAPALRIYFLEGRRPMRPEVSDPWPCFLLTDSQLEATWRKHEAELVAEWIETQPGTRPWAFWEWSAPGPRLRTGGEGVSAPDRWENYGAWLSFGIEVNWAHVDPDDPPRFESEAAYLQRHNLMSAAERRRLPADAFEDDTIEGPGLEDDDDTLPEDDPCQN